MKVATEGPHGFRLMNVATEDPGSILINVATGCHHGSILMNVATEDPLGLY